MELRERVRQILGLESYGRRSDVSTTELRDTLHPDLILAMVDRYLKKNGFNKARSMLKKESNIFTQDNAVLTGEALEDDDLVGLIRLGSTANVFDDPTESQSNIIDPELEAGMYGIISVTDIDVNIWEEPVTPRSIVLNSAVSSGYSGHINLADSNIRGATLNRLVLLLLTDKSRDADFRRVFFGTLHSFTSPPQLMNKFIEYYQRPAPSKLSPQEANTLASIIRYWFDHHPFDFTHDVKKMMKKFIESFLLRDGHKAAAQKLQSAIPSWENSTAAMEGNSNGAGATTTAIGVATSDNIPNSARGSTSLTSTPLTPQYPEPKVPKNIFSPTLVIDDVDEEEIARQLTVVDFELYRVVQSAEFLGRKWALEGGRSAPRLSRLLQRFDRVARWVSSQVVNSASGGGKDKKVAKFIARLLKIADVCLTTSNLLDSSHS